MATDDREYEDMREALGNARIVIWFCPDRSLHGKEVDENGRSKPTVQEAAI